MAHTASHARHDAVAIGSLLLGATTWGVIWYPFRHLEAAGLSSALSTMACYAVAVVLGMAIAPRAAREMGSHAGAMAAIALCAGVANVAFLIAATGTQVVRVVLLFYLAPLWTVPLAWLMLGEHIDRRGALVVAVAMAGALIMMWRPELGAPLPHNGYEWLAVLAGFFFAIANVLVRRAQAASAAAKGLASCVGVLLVAIPAALVLQPQAGTWWALAMPHWLLVGVIGLLLLGTTVAMQFGLTVVPANRAAVILLSELIIAALAAYLLAGEVVRSTDWIGGAFIVAAGMLSTLAHASGRDKA